MQTPSAVWLILYDGRTVRSYTTIVAAMYTVQTGVISVGAIVRVSSEARWRWWRWNADCRTSGLFMDSVNFVRCNATNHFAIGATLPWKVVVTWRRRDLVSGARRSRRRRREHRRAKCAEWDRVWGGVSPPQPTRGSGGASWAPTPGSGADCRPLSHFLHVLGHRTLLVARKIRFSYPNSKFQFEKVVVAVGTGGLRRRHRGCCYYRPSLLAETPPCLTCACASTTSVRRWARNIAAAV